MVKTTQRLYSGRALEAWLDRLLVPWEADFSRESLQRGRDIYRAGEVRSMELTESCAIITHKTAERNEVFATIEWVDNHLTYRHSNEDTALGNALAVAGLYEIEELVADEVTPVPEDAGAGSNASGQTPTEGHAPPGVVPASPVSPGRPLRVLLDWVAAGIRLRAFWRDAGAGEVPAFRETRLDRAERGHLIRLTGAARRAHFRYQESSGDYLLDEASRIAPFVRDELPRLRSLFEIEADPRLAVLERGVQEADARLSIEENESRPLARARMDFFLGNDRLPASTGSRLAADPKTVFLLPEVGLVRLRTDVRTTVEGWRELLGHRMEREIPRYMLFSFLGESTLAEDRVRLSDGLADWRASLDRVNGTRPESLPSFLRTYQKNGVEWMDRLAGYGCHPLLADEMGLGKTLQVLILLEQRWERDGPVLIVCPASVIPVWQGEIARFVPHFQVSVLDKASSWKGAPPDRIWLASYSQLRRRRKELEGTTFAHAILDEAQSIKNPDAKVTQACFSIQARHRLALTGTPVENRHLDMWTLFRFLMPGFLGSRRRFESRLADRPEDTTRQLARQIQPFMLRRTKRAVATELPEKVEMPLWCPLTEPQSRTYKRVAETGLLQFGEGPGANGQTAARRRMGVLALLTRLRQICCDPSLVEGAGVGPGHSGKLAALLPKVREVVESGRKAVIFSQFTGFLDRARAAIRADQPDLPLYQLTGRTRDRAAPVKAFQESEEAGVFLISLRAGGVGITLTRAEYVFLLDPWWNPAVEAQAIDRVHRIGQSQTVFVYRLVSRGTVEERIEALKNSKRALFEDLVGDAQAWSSLEDHLHDLSSLIEYRAQVD